jgi:ubiquinone/menaquinone biosynthesis C-methylase UbiE
MHTFVHHHPRKHGGAVASETQGRILNWGWRYDAMVWIVDTVLLRGKLRELRQRTIDLAQIHPGDRVLDVGCGTGTLAIEVQQRLGATGGVFGIDAAPEQIARARSKATRRKLPIDFRIGLIECLPFPDQSLDVVLSTIMLHHLPDDLKQRGLREIARVLTPGGRLVIADFKRPEDGAGEPAPFGAGHAGVQDLPALVENAGLSPVETGEMRLPRFPHVPGSGVGFIKAIKDRSGAAT